MLDVVKVFLAKVKEQGHVLPLIKQANLQLDLHCEQQTIQIVIKNGDVFILQDAEGPLLKSEISGNEMAMKLLLEGKERLRVLKQNRQLNVLAPLRTILLLESIFYLTKAQDRQLVKII
jgi:hypothetical protein